MSQKTNELVRGIYASTICPMHADASLDEPAIADHVTSIISVQGIKGVLCNGHAGENFTLTRAEKRRVVEITRQAAGPKAVIVSGVNQENSAEAAREALDAETAGADVILVFPPNSWGMSHDLLTVLTHHKMVIEAVKLPVMLFQASIHSGQMAYPQDTIRELVRLSHVIGIKEGSWECATYEANRRLVKKIAPHVAVMASGDEHLLSCFVVGSEGSLVSLAAIIPDTIVALETAVRQNDLVAARKAHDVIYPMAKAIYGASPAGFATARLKTCLKLMGKLECDTMRAPIRSLNGGEIQQLRIALEEAGII